MMERKGIGIANPTVPSIFNVGTDIISYLNGYYNCHEDRLTDFFHFAGTYAASAHMHPNVGAVRPHCLDALDVRFGHLLGSIVGMAHLVSTELALAAYFACTRHL